MGGGPKIIDGTMVGRERRQRQRVELPRYGPVVKDDAAEKISGLGIRTAVGREGFAVTYLSFKFGRIPLQASRL